VTPEQLRQAALDALGELADERARDILRRASLQIASSRRFGYYTPVFDAFRVTLGVDASTLGLLTAAPALVDAVNAALAVAVATGHDQKLVDLAFRWSPAARPHPTAYRDAAPEDQETTLHEGLVAYLEAAGDLALATTMASGKVSPDPRDPAIDVHLPRAEHDVLRSDGYAVRRLESATRDLFSRTDMRVRLHVLT
jgi:hypothetical protein